MEFTSTGMLKSYIVHATPSAYLALLVLFQVVQDSGPMLEHGILAASEQKLVSEERVINGLCSGSNPTLFKQIPFIIRKLSAGGRHPESWHVTV